MACAHVVLPSTSNSPVDGEVAVGAGLVALEAGVAAARVAADALRQRLAFLDADAKRQEMEQTPVLEACVRNVRARLAPAATELAKMEARALDLQEELVREHAEMEGSSRDAQCTISRSKLPAKVWLNVGGQPFQLSSSMACRASPFLRALLEVGMSRPGVDEIFLDRDSKHFQMISDFVHLGADAVHPGVARLTSRERIELATESDFYGLHKLTGLAANPSVGSMVAASIPAQELADKGVSDDLLHHVCRGWHSPGKCDSEPMACVMLGTAIVPCLVTGYMHWGRRGVEVEEPVSLSQDSGDCFDPASPVSRTRTASYPASAAIWVLEFGGHVFKVEAGSIVWDMKVENLVQRANSAHSPPPFN